MVRFNAKDDNSCPRCGGKGEIEVDYGTGQILVVCSNRSCHSLLKKVFWC